MKTDKLRKQVKQIVKEERYGIFDLLKWLNRPDAFSDAKSGMTRVGYRERRNGVRRGRAYRIISKILFEEFGEAFCFLMWLKKKDVLPSEKAEYEEITRKQRAEAKAAGPGLEDFPEDGAS